MSFVKTSRKSDLFGHRVLIIALAISLAGHLFWLSAVKIVSAPAAKSPVKFSKIAFLGPILTRIDMEVRASPAARSLLETRYRNMAGEMLYGKEMFAKATGSKYEIRDVPGQADQKLLHVIDDVIAGEKIEPDYPVE
jgi:hypothetical protein